MSELELTSYRICANSNNNSGIPGLMGIQSLERNNALIRCRTGEIYFLGEGGADIKASPGSRHFQMKKGKTGHWMLPISNFSDQHKKAGIVLNTSSQSANSTADVSQLGQ